MYKSYWRESIQSGSKLCENRGKTDHKRHELQWEEENYHVSNTWSHGQFCGVSLNLCGSLDCAMSCKSKDSIHHDLLQNRPACFQKFIRLTFKHDLNMCTQLYLEILSKQTVCPKGCFGLPGPYSRCLNCQFLMVFGGQFRRFWSTAYYPPCNLRRFPNFGFSIMVVVLMNQFHWSFCNFLGGKVAVSHHFRGLIIVAFH